MDFGYLGTVLLLVFGFGFVIFWHELGHFLAAKWAGVKVEQFAVGFGQALISWRQGLGFRVGTSRGEYEKRTREYLKLQEEGLTKDAALAEAHSDEMRLEYAAAKLGISETEYRLNWIPLGGYVKMLGQDDMDPTSISASPRAYNNKSIGKRMVIVSAGVIMNIILAIILFTILFRIGFDTPPPVVGVVQPGSPAAKAGLQVGDRLLTFGDAVLHDFGKIQMNVALTAPGEPVNIRVLRPVPGKDPVEVTIPQVVARRSDVSPTGFQVLGIMPSRELRGIDPKKVTPDDQPFLEKSPVKPGEKIVAINGQPVTNLKDYHLLDAAVQEGRPVPITVEDPQGQRHERTVSPTFLPPFDNVPFNIAGMAARVVITGIEKDSSAKGKLEVGDIIDEVRVQPANDPIAHPTLQKLIDVLSKAGENGSTVDVTVYRNGEKLPPFTKLDPSRRLSGQNGRKGLGIGLEIDENHPVIAAVLQDSPAAAAGVQPGSTVISVAGEPVKTWFDVQRIIAGRQADQPFPMETVDVTGQTKTVEMKLTPDQLAAARGNRYAPDVILHDLTEPRQTANPLVAAQWGVIETRDLIIQFYLTIQRMIDQTVSPKNMMGPIGIFHQGSRIAYKGHDWLIWFLAMISANLAVVNFLPIPIVDGGLFVFLILEKIMGRPLSPRAQSIAQIIGLAMIASVFLFVTYHDIYRMVF